MSGKDLSEEILTTRPKIKTLFMSGYTATAVSEHGILERGVHFIEEPYSPAPARQGISQMKGNR